MSSSESDSQALIATIPHQSKGQRWLMAAKVLIRELQWRKINDLAELMHVHSELRWEIQFVKLVGRVWGCGVGGVVCRCLLIHCKAYIVHCELAPCKLHSAQHPRSAAPHASPSSWFSSLSSCLSSLSKFFLSHCEVGSTQSARVSSSCPFS